MKYFFLFFCCIITKLSFAQFTPPMRINTPYGTATIPGTYNHNFFMFTKPEFESYKHKFLIELKNGKVIEEEGKILLIDSISYLDYKDSGERKKLFANETKNIYREHYSGKIFKGIALNDNWVFLLDTGKINTYTITSDFEQIKNITHIQKGVDSEILKLTVENLKPMILDNPKALELLEKKKILKALKEYNKINK